MTETNPQRSDTAGASPQNAKPKNNPAAGCLGLPFFVLIIAGLFGSYQCWVHRNTSELWRAARDGDLAAVQRLVEGGEDVNQRTGMHDETALHVAAGLGHVEVAKYLLEKGASVTLRDSDRYTPLHSCARYNAKGGPSKKTEAARNQIASMILAKGADVRATASIQITALHDAAFTDNLTLAEMLLSHGADPNAKQGQAMTPLHYASFSRHDDPAMANLLLKFDADPNVKDQYGKTPLDYASEYEPQFAAVLRQHAPATKATDGTR